MSVSTKAKTEENMNPSSKQKPTDDGGETDAETAASTPARSSVSSPNPDLSSVSTNKNDTGSTSLPSEINTSNSTAMSFIKVEEGDYTNWPLSDIKEPHHNDVLYGRGGGTNHHPGNKRYRKIVEGRKVDYVNSKRLDKPQVALSIIKEWRSQKPPGRFLKLDEATSLWHDVGDKKAREKTSQALREKAPLLRKQQEEQRKERENSGQAGPAEKVKNTRFDVPAQSSPSKNLKRAMLTRDHSLGREYVPAGETVSVKGFSWNSPILNEPIDEVQHSWEAPIELSRSSDSGMGQPADPYVHRDAYGVGRYSTAAASSPSRYHHNGEWSSTTTANPTTHQPRTPNEPIVGDWRTGYRTDEGVRKDYAATTTNYDYRRSRSAPEDRYYDKRGYYPHHQAPPPPPKAPSTNNSQLHSGDYERVASMVGGPPPPEPPHPTSSSNYMHSWKSMNSPRHHSDGMYDTSPYQSPDRMNPMTPSTYGHWNSPAASSHTSPPPSTMDYYNNNPYRVEGQSYSHRYSHGNNVGAASPPMDVLPRPPTVKRDTSHKLQTVDVEPTTKRLNRQSSSGRRNASISSIEEITDKDMNHLNVSLKRGASLGTTYSKDDVDLPRKPLSLKESDRLSTIDKFLVGMDVPDDSPSQSRKPRPLVQGDRVTTIDQINTLVKDIDGTSSYPLDGLSNSFHDTEDVLDDIGEIYKQNVSADSEIFGGVLANTEPV